MQVLETLLHLRISQVDIQSLKQHNEKKSAVELKIEKNKNRMEKKLKGKISKKEKKVRAIQSFFPKWCVCCSDLEKKHFTLTCICSVVAHRSCQRWQEYWWHACLPVPLCPFFFNNHCDVYLKWLRAKWMLFVW